MAEADSKPVAVAQDTPATEPKAATEETKVETAEGASGAKDTESKPITEKAGAAASAMKDNVFSMFGGGPKKEKKEEEDAVDEPSGSSKAQPKDEVCFCRLTIPTAAYNMLIIPVTAGREPRGR
jgi:Ran-binding protein 1